MMSTHVENCSTIQELQFESIDLPAIKVVFTILYTVVWIGSTVGNGLVLYVVSFNQISLSVRSVFIGCLAVSDLLMGMTSLPITAVTTFTRHWVFPSFFCKLIGVFQGGSIFVSSFTLTAIAIDRCILILRPNEEVIGYNRAINIVVGIWVLGYSLALPVGIYSKTTGFDGICGLFCEETWPDYSEETNRSDHRRIYGLTVLLMQFGIPTVISSVCYWMISRVMTSQLEKRRGQQKLLPDKENKLVNRKTRANRMMIAMVSGLVLAWMPLNAINIYRDFFTFGENPWVTTIFALCHVSAMTSAVWNPLIYSWFNPQFRSAIKTLFRGSKDSKKKFSRDTKNNTEVVPLRTSIRLKMEMDKHPDDQIL